MRPVYHIAVPAGHPILVLDDPGGEPLDRLVDGPMEPGLFFPIAIGLAHALGELRPEDMGRLFEAFYTTKPHGMGLGLAISRPIIEAHGGRLWAEPKPGRGAMFAFRLPVADGTAAG